MERILTDKANYLATHGYQVTIVTTEQKGRETAFPLAEGIVLKDLAIGYEDNNGTSFLNKLLSYPAKQRRHRKALAAVLAEERPDIAVSLFDGDERFLHKMKDGSKKVLEIHFSRFKRLQYGRKGLWALADRCRSARDGSIVRKYGRFVVLTEEDLGYWKKPVNACVIPNFLSRIPKDTAASDNKTVLAVGRCDHQKGFERLIRAWAILPGPWGWKLRIVGDGPQRGELQKLAKKLCVEDSIEFPGICQDMDKEYREAAFLAVSSRYEGLPMAMLEAQSYGLPIVAYDCKCGPRDVISDGEDGILVKEGNIPLMTLALTRMMEDERMRKEMGGVALKRSERWNRERIMEKWTELFANI